VGEEEDPSARRRRTPSARRRRRTTDAVGAMEASMMVAFMDAAMKDIAPTVHNSRQQVSASG
jgi:hypothetical protein